MITNLPHHRGAEATVEAAKSLLREYQFGRSQRRTREAAVRRRLHARLHDFSGHPDQAGSLTRSYGHEKGHRQQKLDRRTTSPADADNTCVTGARLSASGIVRLSVSYVQKNTAAGGCT